MDPRRIAEEFAQRIKAEFPDRIERVLLFGSVARGESRPSSDVDLLVVTRDTSWDFRRRLAAEAVEVLVHEGIYVSAKPVTPEEFARTEDTLFGRNVRAEGLILA